MFIKEINYRRKWSLGKYCTVFQAEAFALLGAVRYIAELGVRDATVGFFTDSLAVVKALMQIQPTSSIIQEVIAALNKVGSINKVSVSWIKGHSGVAENEVSDRVARNGAKGKFCGPEPVLPVLECVVKESVEQWVSEEFRKS